MIFNGYFNLSYSVKELSLKQAELIFAQQAEANELKPSQNIEQLLNQTYSFRTCLNMNKTNHILR